MVDHPTIKFSSFTHILNLYHHLHMERMLKNIKDKANQSSKKEKCDENHYSVTKSQ